MPRAVYKVVAQPRVYHMPQFICPHCQHLLNVRDQDLGRQGRCNKCGERIALIGRPSASPLLATSVATVVHAVPGSGGSETEDRADAPVSEKQAVVLRRAGISDEQLGGMNQRQASQWIERLADGEGPTEKQVTYLKRLGAMSEQIGALQTRRQASALIEEMHLMPTQAQIDLLRKLGAPGERIARIKSKGEASAVIEELRK